MLTLAVVSRDIVTNPRLGARGPTAADISVANSNDRLSGLKATDRRKWARRPLRSPGWRLSPTESRNGMRRDLSESTQDIHYLPDDGTSGINASPAVDD
ncbi:hypothetical protein EYF80_044528 [Liparis tanakae]|uniref:Uncharacterized protein n=1 Tax=Liparis tanakae TaxID=230148 RepID=A0A4Z2FVL7_9TELE|nr:hypothetical protein EYF80_044528 [Liparis tanakae]